MTARILRLASPDDTRRLGTAVAAVCRAGDLIVLDGPLGAGKTVLVQGLAAGLGVRAPVTSPTFVIARVHRDGWLPLVHVDAYRLSSIDEIDDLDLDASAQESVTVVEWGSGLVESLADAHLRIELSRPRGEGAADEDERTTRLVPVGGDWVERVRLVGGSPEAHCIP